ncbi:Nif3-like dinuclear metal center hexameric protein [Aspergillus glaucus CBS 516.65]|uniref:NGG1 interacting factor Nif3 n=1 Tax=Aspergillus glaucus CBS 516.65 TaxID=1160497 RepID=A0A1L9VG06_ASPGL|nr:hypothetical protein ASPGLDRAFT_48952 [Aspergillus glaucus CBS 516.65]OJJ82833.1 hypothetical protein ASPGLDRAFT_48952 [Aspergillus glaucus CBS 516.65]
MPSSSPTYCSPFTRAVVNSMRKLYPEALADKSWDNTGLLLEAPFNPSQHRPRNSVLLAIDLTKAVADEAINRRDSVVVAYHPIIFRGLKSLTLNDPQQTSLLRLAQAGISVYSPHTAIDSAPGGMGDWLCDIVTGCFISKPQELPPAPAEQKPIPQLYTQPTYPQPTGITENPLQLEHTRKTIHPSQSVPEGCENAGMGRLVTFSEPQPLSMIIDHIAAGVGNPGGIPIAIPQGSQVEDTRIRTVGVCPGSGSSVLMKGVSEIPDLMFTGEMSHHEALAAIEQGKVVVSLSHSNTERGYLRAVMKEKLQNALQEEWESVRQEGLKTQELEMYEDGGCEVDVSKADRDPYGIMIRRI